jgi:hypothetical protein
MVHQPSIQGSRMFYKFKSPIVKSCVTADVIMLQPRAATGLEHRSIASKDALRDA